MSDLIKTLKSSETGDNVYPNIKEDNIPSGAVKTAKLDDEAVTTDKIGTMSVTTPKIDTGAVTTAKISDSAVTTIKLNDSAVTTAKISDGAVTSGKIGSSAVTNAKINDGAVSYDKLASALKNLIDGKASQTDLETLQTALTTHVNNTSNPHNVTKAQVGLGNVDNTSDANKPISTATQTALDLKQDKLTAGTNITIDANNVISASGGGGSQLYEHNIDIYKSGEGEIYLKFISASSSPILSPTALRSILPDNGSFTATGYVVQGDFDYSGSIYCLYVLDGNLEEIQFSYIANGVLNVTGQSADFLINSSATWNDYVITL